MAGRKPKPTHLKLINGNPGKRPLNQNEPDPPRGVPDMPKWLEFFPVAVAEWKNITKILYDSKILTMADGGAVAKLCFLEAKIQELAAEKDNKELGRIKNLITECRQIGSLLGLDPSSRSRLSVPGGKKTNKFDNI